MSLGAQDDFPLRGRAPDRRRALSYPAARTIAALVLRETSTRFGRTPGGFIWAILQPLAIIVIMGLAFSLIARTPSLGTSFIFFKATGMLPFFLFRNLATTIGKSLSFSSALIAYPGVTWMDAVLARLILNVMVSLVVSTLILTGIVLVEGLTLIIDWDRVIEAYALAVVLGFGVGILNCYLFERFDVWNNVWNIMTAPLMIISGVIILYEELPAVAQKFLWYNPVMHITAMAREGMYSIYQPSFVSVPYVVSCALVPMVLGLLLVRKHHLYLLNR